MELLQWLAEVLGIELEGEAARRIMAMLGFAPPEPQRYGGAETLQTYERVLTRPSTPHINDI